MKKLVLMMVVIVLGLSMVACGPYYTEDNIMMRNFYHDDTISLPLPVNKGRKEFDKDALHFDRTESLEELSTFILGRQTATLKYETKIYGNTLLITKLAEKNSYFTIKLTSASSNRYTISNLTAKLYFEDTKQETAILFPYHFSPQINDIVTIINSGKDIATDATYEQIVEFYTKLDRYFNVASDTTATSISFDRLDMDMEYKRLTIKHKVIDGKNFINITSVK